MKPVIKRREKETFKTKKKSVKAVESFKLKRSSKPLAGIDIGSHTIKIAVGQYKNNKIVLKKLCSTKTTEGTVRDSKLVRKDGAVAAIANLLQETKIKDKDFVCAVESSEVVRREMLLPSVGESEIMGLITYEIGQYLPINPDSYIIQYKVLESHAGEDGQQLRLMVCAMPKNLAVDYMDILQNLHLKPCALDINTNALGKLLSLKTAREGNDRNIVFIDMGHNQFSISLFHNKDCLFSKKSDIGGYTLNDILLTNLEIGERDAEKLKISNLEKISVIQLSNEYGRELTLEEAEEQEQVVLKGFMDVIDHWVDEIDQILKYMTREKGVIDEVFLYGGCSRICDIDAYFQKKLNIKTKCFEISNSVTGKVDMSQIPIYLNAICALIRNG